MDSLRVGQRPVVAQVGRGGVVGPRIPASDEFLDAGDVDAAVVHVVFELGHVARQEGPVGAMVLPASGARRGSGTKSRT